MNDTRKDVNGVYPSAAFFGYRCMGPLLEVTRGLTIKEMFAIFQTCKDIRLNSILGDWGPDLCNSKAVEFAKKFTKASKKRSIIRKKILRKIGIISAVVISLFVISLIVDIFTTQFYISGKMWLWSLFAYAVLTIAITAADMTDYIMVRSEIIDIYKNINLFAFNKWSGRNISM